MRYAAMMKHDLCMTMDIKKR